MGEVPANKPAQRDVAPNRPDQEVALAPRVSMFLSPDEVEYLTGYKRAARQIAELKRRGYRFDVNAMGLPVVPRSAVEARIAREKTNGPRWDAMK